jgi:hypothetical protein
VLLVAPDANDLHNLRQILQLYAGASGLVTNVEKCVAMPIRCSAEELQAVQQAFPCVLAQFPGRYLGVPLSLSQLRRADEQPLVDAVAARIPTWKAGLLTHSGRVLLTKVTLTDIPIHLSISCYLSKWALDQIDKRRRAFLWSGTVSTAGAKCKVAWPVVCRPTNLGGLGVLDLRFFGFALRLRWEWLARTAIDCSWSSLPSKPEKSVTAMAAASIRFVLVTVHRQSCGRTPGHMLSLCATMRQTFMQQSLCHGGERRRMEQAALEWAAKWRKRKEDKATRGVEERAPRPSGQ